jgi:hypothetical protein
MNVNDNIGEDLEIVHKLEIWLLLPLKILTKQPNEFKDIKI